jgi:long-chain acyl-CoA synthetase
MSLEAKIHQARSLDKLSHNDKQVCYANIEELLKAQVSKNLSKNYLVYYFAKDFKEKSCSDLLKEEISYSDFYKKVAQTVNLLKDCGLKKGDRVATISHNHSDTVIQYFAAWTMGLVVVPINVSEDPERITYILNFAEVKLAFIRDAYQEKILKLLKDLPKLQNIICTGNLNNSNEKQGSTQIRHFSEIESFEEQYDIEAAKLDDEALIVFTSGTTGNPKAVVLSQYNLLVDSQNISEWHELKEDQSMMCVLPIHHVNGTIVTIMSTMFFGGTLVLNDKFRTNTFFENIAKEKVKVVSVVPTLLAFLLEGFKKDNSIFKNHNLSDFRHIICGAGPLTVDLALEFENTFKIPIIHGYGLSETTCYSCFLPINLSDKERQLWLKDYHFPSIGVELPCNEMAIHDENGNSVSESERGEIVIRGHNVMSGYYDNPEANAETFKHGWFRSGDEGFYQLDKAAKKYFFITGRLKELIIRGGVNVSPLEIDEVLMSIPGVKAGISVGFENNMYGEEIGAYVQLEEDSKLSEEEIIKACAKELPFHKQPKVIIFGDDIPVTSTGKYQRNKLKPLFKDCKGIQYKNSK